MIYRIASLCILGLASCATISDLDVRIEGRKAELELISERLEHAIDERWSMARDVMVELRYRPVDQYLRELTSPNLTVRARGTEVRGDFWYEPGVGKAWLHPPRDANAYVMLRHSRLSDAGNEVAWASQLNAGIEARAHFDILNIEGNVLCRGRVGAVDAAGRLLFIPEGIEAVRYTLEIEEPQALEVRMECDMGRFGTKGVNIDVDKLADRPLSGTFDLALRESGAISWPGDDGADQVNYRLISEKVLIQHIEGGLLVGADIRVELHSVP